MLYKLIAGMAFGTVTVAHASGCFESAWDYDYNGSDWAALGECSGSKQSPIDIVPAEVRASNDSKLDNTTGVYELTALKRLTAAAEVEFTAENNGHSAKFKYEGSEKLKIEGGILPNAAEYCLDSLHFHWGVANGGSEHRLKGEQKAMEMHAVFYDCACGNLTQALKESDAKSAENGYKLAVIGTFFELKSEGSSKLENVLDALSSLTDVSEHTTVTLDTGNFVQEEYGDFYAYLGSLTTPTCNEAVRWHVTKQMEAVSAEQLEEFRELLECDNTTLTHNWRQTQTNSNPLWSMCSQSEVTDNDDSCTRIVESTLAPDNGSPTKKTAFAVAVAVSLVLVSLF